MDSSGNQKFATALTTNVASLDPGYFALVMATGIVSVSMEGHGLTVLSRLLLAVAALSWCLLIVLNGWRLLRYREAVLADLFNGRRAFSFFTFVAATNVLGTRLGIVDQNDLVLALLVLGVLSCLGLGYSVPWLVAFRSGGPRGVANVNGTWFNLVVAVQSVSVLAATLEPTARVGQREFAAVAVFSWSVGACLYAAIAVGVMARLMLYPTPPSDLTPPYWVAMGATAISVLAGARIVEMTDAPMVEATRGLVAGSSVVLWSLGSALIPLLIAAGWWRHVIHRVPVRYDPALWSIVFPLGMYSVAGHYLGRADALPLVHAVGTGVSWIALTAWVVVFTAMLWHLVDTLGRQPRRRGSPQQRRLSPN